MDTRTQGNVSDASRSPARTAFTLVELLVVIGIIGVLLAMLLPALAAVRARASATECSNNVRQICAAILTYGNDNRGYFPPNVTTPSPGRYWYDRNRVGAYLPGFVSPAGDLRGRGVTCPEDTGAVRSYAMNIWASSAADPSVLASGRGTLWTSASMKTGQNVILVAEKWSNSGNAGTGYLATATLGYLGTTTGQHFGAGSGLSPLWNAARFGPVNCELPYYRHRQSESSGPISTPKGRVNLGYADGHVSMKSELELADPATGLSRLESLWTSIDEQLNN